MSQALMAQKRLRSSMVNWATWLGPKTIESTVPDTIMHTPPTMRPRIGFLVTKRANSRLVTNCAAGGARHG